MLPGARPGRSRLADRGRAQSLRHAASSDRRGGALLLGTTASGQRGTDRITEAYLYAGAATKEPAVRAIGAEVAAEGPGEWLVDCALRVSRSALDRAEASPGRCQGAQGFSAAGPGRGLERRSWQFVPRRAALADGSAARGEQITEWSRATSMLSAPVGLAVGDGRATRACWTLDSAGNTRRVERVGS